MKPMTLEWVKKAEGDFLTVRNGSPSVEIIREIVAGNMTADEIHDDICSFFDRLRRCVADEGGLETEN